MKQLALSLLGIIFCLSSCINEDYNWDNINKEAVVPIGNIPIGNIEKITLDSLLPQSLKEHILVGEDNIFYLKYSDRFDIETPTTTIPSTPVVSIETVTYPILGGSISLPSGQVLPIKSGGETPYQIEKPYFESDDWGVAIESIKFKTCDFVVDVNLDGISFVESGATKGKLEVDLEFPENIQVAGVTDNKISRIINLEDLSNNSYTFPAIRLESFSYEENLYLKYSASIVFGDNTTLVASGGQFSFDMSFSTTNMEPEVIYGEVTMNQLIEGTFADIHDLDDAFGEDDVLVFANPLLYLNVATNLGANFAVLVDELEARNGSRQVHRSNVAGVDGFVFTKPATVGAVETSSFVIGNTNPNTGATFKQFDMAPLFQILPTDMDYKIRISNQAMADKSAFYIYDDLQVSANYEIVMPFSFSNLDMHLSETLTDVFSDDLNEYLFFSEGEFIISADQAILDFGSSTESVLEVICSVSILDEYDNPIGVDITPIYLENGDHPLEIVIHIEESDLNALQRARHLAFNFTLSSKEGKTVTLRSTDSIEIKGLKIKSSTGVKFDLEDL